MVGTGAPGPGPNPPAAVPNPALGVADRQAGPGADGVDPAPSARSCPHCGSSVRAASLFCESCGYDFTTGALPRPLAEGLAAIDTRVAPAVPTPTPTPTPEPTAAPDVTLVSDAKSEPDVTPEADARPEPDPARVTAPAPETVERTPVPDGKTDPSLARPRAAADSGTTRAPSRQARGDWVVEMWVDPEWFAAQETGEASPSPGVPDVVRLRGRALVGRYSASRRIVPEVDCGADSGVSRRHAEFTTDGTRWWVEDVGSSNGTFVGPARGPLPERPIPPGQRVEVSDDDRIYVGAWTRLVVRHATASDLSGTG